jgi:23S rRNA (guanosine2251-2'-O)-methyltransferase
MSPSPSSRPDRPVSPKDAFVTVYGRKPVLEALGDPALEVDKVVLAEGVDREAVRTFTAAARARGLVLQRASAQRVKVLAGNGRQDQGVLADVVAPRMRPLEHFLDDLPDQADARVLVLDGLTNPSNVGMILRSATGAGLEGVLLPRRGAPSIDPLVVKASAGVAFTAPVLRCYTAEEAASALRDAGYTLVAMDASARDTVFTAAFPDKVAFVLGSETSGITDGVRPLINRWVSIPMAGGVESLNVASAAAVLCFELVRRSRPGSR